MIVVGQAVGIYKVGVYAAKLSRFFVHDAGKILPSCPRDVLCHAVRDFIGGGNENGV